MRVISRKILRDYCEQNPKLQDTLISWAKDFEKNAYEDYNQISTQHASKSVGD